MFSVSGLIVVLGLEETLILDGVVEIETGVGLVSDFIAVGDS